MTIPPLSRPHIGDSHHRQQILPSLPLHLFSLFLFLSLFLSLSLSLISHKSSTTTPLLSPSSRRRFHLVVTVKPSSLPPLVSHCRRCPLSLLLSSLSPLISLLLSFYDPNSTHVPYPDLPCMTLTPHYQPPSSRHRRTPDRRRTPFLSPLFLSIPLLPLTLFFPLSSISLPLISLLSPTSPLTMNVGEPRCCRSPPLSLFSSLVALTLNPSLSISFPPSTIDPTPSAPPS